MRACPDSCTKISPTIPQAYGRPYIVVYAPTVNNMDPSEANLVNLSAASIDFDFVSEIIARDEIAPRPEIFEGFSFGGLFGLELVANKRLDWIVDMEPRMFFLLIAEISDISKFEFGQEVCLAEADVNSAPKHLNALCV